MDGSGSSALRDYVSDGVGNATQVHHCVLHSLPLLMVTRAEPQCRKPFFMQDSNLGGLYLPFYTEGTGVGASLPGRSIRR